MSGEEAGGLPFAASTTNDSKAQEEEFANFWPVHDSRPSCQVMRPWSQSPEQYVSPIEEAKQHRNWLINRPR